MVTQALREVMLAAEGAGRLAGAGVVTVAADHPVCGDRVEFDCRVDGERIVAVAWRAAGCPATMAVAALAPRALAGGVVADAARRLQDHVRELGGLAPTEAHALAMAQRALREVVAR